MMSDEMSILGFSFDKKQLFTEILCPLIVTVIIGLGVFFRKSFCLAFKACFQWLKLERYGRKQKNLPSLCKNERFVGREMELEQVHKCIKGGGVPLIYAEGGMGKSELALEYARRNFKYYTGGVFRVSMDKIADWDSALRCLYKSYVNYLNEMNIGEPSPRSTSSGIEGVDVLGTTGGDAIRKRDEVKKAPCKGVTSVELTPNEIRATLLARLKRDRVLLIFDNMERSSLFLLHANNSQKGLPALLGADIPDTCHIIATSQRVDGFSPSETVKPISLRRLSVADGVALFNKICPPRSVEEGEAVDKINQFLQGHPLSIELLASDVSINYDRGVTYVKKLESLWHDDFDLAGQSGDCFNYGEKTPQSVLKPTIESLLQNEGEKVLRLAQVISLFPAEGVQWHVMLAIWRQLIHPAASDADGFARDMAVLKQYSLIKINGDIFAKSDFDAELVTMHRFTREAMKQDLIEKKQRGKLVGRVGAALKDYVGFGVGDWIGLAGQSDLFAKCPFDRFDGVDWLVLLSAHPEFHERCDFAKLTGMQIADLLSEQSQFEKKCKFSEFTGENWAWLLSKKPTYASSCAWESLSFLDWCDLLGAQPQFANRCPWFFIPDHILVDLCKIHPLLVFRHVRLSMWIRMCVSILFAWVCKVCNLVKMLVLSGDFLRVDGKRLGKILFENPQWAERCDWKRLNGAQWEQLLCGYPQFARYCEWECLDGSNWARLLVARPQFAEVCNWSKFNGWCWTYLLCRQPQFADKVQWSTLTGSDWARLVSMRAGFCGKCAWEKLSNKDWAVLLLVNPEMSKRRDWTHMSGADWVLMIQVIPRYAQWCDWSKLDGRAWVILLCYDPRYANKCDWGKLSKEERIVLLKKQPQLIRAFNNWRASEQYGR